MIEVKVTPVPGRRVRMPEGGRLLASTGETVPRNGYWLRKWQAGDVAMEPVSAAAAPAGSTAKTSKKDSEA